MTSVLHAKASAPGKAIIFGEHAVVYGVNAIAAALSDLRISVAIDVLEGEPKIDVFFKDIVDGESAPTTASISLERVESLVAIADVGNPFITVSPTDEIALVLTQEFATLPSAAGQCMTAITFLFSGIALSALKKMSAGDNKSYGVKMAVESAGLPIGAGLGSSAAFSVATAGALLQLYFKIAEPGEAWGSEKLNPAVLESINGWAFMGEVLIHGTPSGLDNTTSCYGGMVKFLRTESGNVFDTLKTAPTLNMLLTNTKVPRSTKALVAGVRELYDAMPNVIKPIFQSIDEITTDFLKISELLHNGEISSTEIQDRMAKLIRINHALLEAIGVGHPALSEVVSIGSAHGFASKLTGAGGGGCAITLLDVESEVEFDAAKLEQLTTALRSKGFDVFRTSMGGDGVRWL